MEIVSTCIYCANGCKLKYSVEKGEIKKVLPVKDDPVSLGHPCIKGLTIKEVVNKGRILKPMARINGVLKEVSWRKALNILVKKIKETSSSEMFFATSGKVTNEDNYIIQKFARLIAKTNNIDSCARLCHVATVMGFKDNFGIGASSGGLKDFKELDCLLIIGSNPASNHPIAFNRIVEMKKIGGKIITVSPILSQTAKISDLWIPILPGSETAFLNSLMYVIISSNKFYKNSEKYAGFQGLKNIIERYSPKKVASICGISEKDIKEVASLIMRSKSFGVMHGMGLTQHLNAIENVHSLNNLVLLENGIIVSGRGEINIQGCGDMQCNPLPLGFSSEIQNKALEKFFKGSLPNSKGKNILESLAIRPVKLAFISSFNPAHSMPDLNKIHKNLKKIFLIQMDHYFNLTSKFADLILPTPLLIERHGTITTGERRVRLVSQVRKPIGESLPEWRIYKELASLLKNRGFKYENPKEIFKEITKTIKAYKKINPDNIYDGGDEFADKKIKFKKFIPEEFDGFGATKSKEYPFLIFTFRSHFQFLSNEATKNSKTLSKLAGKPCFYLNKEDAFSLGIKDDDKIRVESNVGKVSGLTRITSEISRGLIGAHFHSEKLLVNKLYPLSFDEETFTPNFKSVAVKIKKL